MARAKESARDEIERYLGKLKNAHWATLAASVRKGGTYDGATKIDLPQDLARKFVEPIAEVWNRQIIQEIRRRSREFTADCEAMVVQLAEWCRLQGARVSPRLLDAQLASLKADIKNIDAAGREAIDTLRDEVRVEISNVIAPPIRAKCRHFVSDGRNQGRGVRDRIVNELYTRLARDASESAAGAAEKLLLNKYSFVAQELRGVLKNLEDPLESASSKILEGHRGRIERDDARKRDRALAAAGTALDTCPVWLREQMAGAAGR